MSDNPETEKYKRKILRPSAVIEFRVEGHGGSFIPLLFSKKRNEWELPGGTADIDFSYPCEDELIENMLRETNEEIGMNLQNSKIIKLNLDMDDKQLGGGHLVRTGSGDYAEVKSKPYVIKPGISDSLPELKVSDEHSEIIFLFFPDFEIGDTGNNRTYARLFNDQIGGVAMLKDAPTNMLSMKKYAKLDSVYAVAEKAENTPVYPISEITRSVLLKYFDYKFLEE